MGGASRSCQALAEPVEVLRVKITETQTVGGFEVTRVCYDLRSKDLIGAVICEGGFGAPPTAIVNVFTAGATDVASSLPDRAAILHPVYPNPVVEDSFLRYDLSEAADVDLAVYDVLGRRVRAATRGAQPPGAHAVPLSLRGLAPGLYVARLQAGATTHTRPFTVVR